MCGLQTKENCNGNGNGVVNAIINANGNGKVHPLPKQNDVFINLDRGDPKVYYPYWKKVDDKCVVTIKASELMSYFADVTPGGCFYQMPEFSDVVKRIHRVVGNAVTEGRYIIGGTGSSQLFTVALRALASTVDQNKNKSIPVVCAKPYYSCYEEALAEEKSEIFQFRGDARAFTEEGPYIEVVTTPNNPDGSIQKPVVNREGGLIISDLAYYWPQYTPITEPMDYDIMLFTLSKATGHAGSRVGWAIVKDKGIATNMIMQMALMTIGTCHEGQLRATKILEHVADCYEKVEVPNGKPLIKDPATDEGFFEFGHRVLAERWEKLRAAVKQCEAFNLPEYNSGYCNFMGKITQPNPAYAWLEYRAGEDAAKLMNELKIRTRSGVRFGASTKYIRVSLLESDETFNLFLERLSTL